MKKLLAIVMVVAMMFSMSVVAMAEEATDATEAPAATEEVTDATEAPEATEEVEATEAPEVTEAPEAAYSATAEAVRNADETVTVNVSTKGDLSAYEIRLYYGEAKVESAELSAEGALDVPNNVTGEGYYVNTGAIVTGATSYDGLFVTYVLSGVKEGATVDIVDGLTGAVLVDDLAIDVKAAEDPTPVPTEAPAPTTPVTTTTPSDNGSANAADTADVAPIATMVTLVVVAGLAIVALKKRATN